MAEALKAPLPPGMDLPDGYTVEWAAIDATGADVSGVVVSGVSIFGTALGLGDTYSFDPGIPILIGTQV